MSSLNQSYASGYPARPTLPVAHSQDNSGYKTSGPNVANGSNPQCSPRPPALREDVSSRTLNTTAAVPDTVYSHSSSYQQFHVAFELGKATMLMQDVSQRLERVERRIERIPTTEKHLEMLEALESNTTGPRSAQAYLLERVNSIALALTHIMRKLGLRWGS
ncbi:hypothetical protein TWF481_002658 [Arthrobotrys musiformis]|uniref:Uncharacterized protein n=1 Tax=Arthrobotrys musiformis TaxID=47236 RepID=A0AAV9VX14_9PEZI